MSGLKKFGEAIGHEFPVDTPMKKNTMLAFLLSGVMMFVPGCVKQMAEDQTIFSSPENGVAFIDDTGAALDTFVEAYAWGDDTMGCNGAGTTTGMAALLGTVALGYAYHRAKKLDL